MPHDFAPSPHWLKHALANDVNGAWTEAFAAQLQALSDDAAISAAALPTDDLKQRCRAVSKGAGMGAQLLPVLRPRLVLDIRQAGKAPHASLLSQSTRTSMLYELGWLAIEAGLTSEGLSVVESIGTLLHGRLGGGMFMVEALLAMGLPLQASEALQDCLAREEDADDLATATLAALWCQRASGRRGTVGDPEPNAHRLH